MQAQKETEEKQRQMDIEFRQEELKRKQFVADDREPQSPLTGYQASSEERSRREAERRQNYDDETAMQRARADVERQRRYLEQRDIDEQSARARRDAAARETPATETPNEPAESAVPPPFRRPPATRKPS